VNRILIADDNAQNLYFLETMLKGYGYEVTSASNGEEALALALGNPPDMIITDILMPKMDGFELCRRFKANKVLQGIPFIFYTATYTDTRDEQFALSLGADRFVLKPQEPEALGQTIREVLNKTPEEKRSLRKPLGDEAEVLRHYNAVLFRKLEKKVLDLEQEIVSRERIAQELREKTEELDRYFNDALDLFCIADTDGRFRRLNKQWERTSGYPLETLQGKSLLDFTHPDDLKSTERTLARLGAREKVLNFVNRFRCEDGAYRCIEWSAVLYGDTMYAAARDITDRKMAEEALIKSESNYRELADSIADIFFAMDCDLRCTYWNRASENFTGIKV
jgi:PAS domain S-box-containing protein